MLSEKIALVARQQERDKARDIPSDINEHIERLTLLARQCKHVTEMGTRTGVSTRAFLFAQPLTLVCIDQEHFKEVTEVLLPIRGRTDLRFVIGDTRKIDIEETDLLFIDTYHTGAQLEIELARHAHKARKFIVLHDTETFGAVGEDGKEPGLMAPLTQFLVEHVDTWRVKEQHKNNNGLTVLERI